MCGEAASGSDRRLRRCASEHHIKATLSRVADYDPSKYDDDLDVRISAVNRV